MPAPSGVAEDASEMADSDMIPYTVHYDDETVITKDDGLVQVIRLDGLRFESMTAAQIKQFERQRNTLLRSISRSDMGVYVHIIRRHASHYPGGQGGTWFSRYFNDAWRNRYKKKKFFINELYISIVKNRFRHGAPGVVDRIFSLVTGKGAAKNEAELFSQQSREIYEASNLVVRSLEAYGARRLCIQRWPAADTNTDNRVGRQAAKNAIERFQMDWDEFLASQGDHPTYESDVLVDWVGSEFSEVAGFFHYLVNLENVRVPVSDLPLSQQLAVSRHNFRLLSNMMEVQGMAETRICAMLSMKEWPSHTPSRMMNEFLRLPAEYIITQSFFFTDRITAENDMRQQRRRMAVNDRETVTGRDRQEIDIGLQELLRGTTVNGLHHLSMMVHVPAKVDSV